MAEIRGAEKLQEVFGSFPVFHDAEVHAVLLERDSLSVTLDLLLPVFSEGSQTNYKVRIRCSDVECLKLRDFNYQNVIAYMKFESNVQGTLYSDEQVPRINVELDPSFGLGASFNCRDVEIIDVQASDAAMGPPPYLRTPSSCLDSRER